MHCPHCDYDLNDHVDACPECAFHIDQLEPDLGNPEKPTDTVADDAKMLSETGASKIRERLTAFNTRTGCEALVVTTPSSAPRKPSEKLFYLFNRWEIGGDEEHLGWMLLLSQEERRIEVEIGVALEPIITDAQSAALLEHQVVPFLKAGHIDVGVFNACDLLCDVIEIALASRGELNT